MKLSLYNGKQQKDHIDETLENMMAAAGFEQSYKGEFMRLGLSYAAVAVALFVYYLERTVTFKNSRYTVGALCLLYFSLTWGAWLFERTYERKAFYSGFKNGTQVWIASSYPKHSDLVKLTLTKKIAGVVSTKDIELKLPKVIDEMAIVHKEELAPIVSYLEESK